MEAMPDPLVERFKPDPDLVARAQRLMMAEETHAQRFLRQRWEHAMGSARVALDSLREIWPSEQASLAEVDRSAMEASLRLAEDLVSTLDRLSEAMLGGVMVQVLMGEIIAAGEIDGLDAQPPPPQSDKREILQKICDQPGQHIGSFTGAPRALVGELLAEGWIEWRGSLLHPTHEALDEFPDFAGLD